jgi:hypothetical protein
MKQLKQTATSILKGTLTFILAAGAILFSNSVKSQEINVPASNVTLLNTHPLTPPGGLHAPSGGGGGAYSIGTGAVFSNVTTFSGSFFPNGGATNVSGDMITKLIANHYTLVGTPPFNMTAFTFSVANSNVAAVSARYRVRFYLADGAGGGPGTAIGGFSFNAISFPAGAISLYNATGISLSLASNDIWVGWTFDDNTGATGATAAQLNSLGMGLYNPVNLGTGYDNYFRTATGGSFLVTNPAGTITASPFGASPVSEFSFEINVPCVAPTVTSPANITVNSSAGVCGAAVTYTPTVTGTTPFLQYFMTGATTALGSGSGSGTVFGIGTTTVNLTATSLSGCGSGSSSFTITVVDAQLPVITCPATANIFTDAGLCTSTSSIGTATATDNCSIGSLVVDNLGPYSVGATTVTWTATDASGNTASCSQVINVTDAEVPVITCPATANLNTDAGICTSSTPAGTATATDNCSVSSVVVDNAGPYPVGATTVTWTATDVNGNTSSCSQVINVTDIELPVITCPPTANLTTDAGICTSSAAAGTATATDNCGIASVLVDNAGPYPVGATTVTWTATDVNGNTSNCTQVINVADSEAPVITCPLTANLNTDAGLCTSSAPAGTATATDNCSVTSVVVDNAGPYSVGATTVTWTATDASGNTSSCSQVINVTDAELPVITCPATANLNTDAGICTDSSPAGTATATDNCSVSSVTVDNAGPYSVGATTVTWTATDANGNTSSCSQVINVTDAELPVITCPATANLNTDAGLCTASSSAGTATATDNCGIASVTVDNAGPYSVGATTVTWTATDVNGNTSSCSQVINVSEIEPPVITCPATANLNTDAGICTSSAAAGTATATDNCAVSSVTVDNAGPYSVGSTAVTWTATDASGNTATCSQVINVTDAEAPVITCPATANINTDAGICTSSTPTGTATATDNCLVSSVTVDNAGPYSVGATTVTWTATDVNGNTSTCAQVINVTDAELPVITCPATANLNTDAGLCTASSSAGTATATDNCSVSSVTVDNAGPYSVGSTTVTWTATDVNGNTASCSQVINVTDTEFPTITAPADVNVCSGATITLGTPTVNDNCGTPTYTNNAPGSYPIGTTVVTWTVTDASGNTASASQNVTVNAAPTGTPVTTVICNGSSANVSLTGSLPGTTFTWTAANTSGSVIGFNNCASGCGTTITDVLSNLAGSGGVVEYTVTPSSATGCPGTPFLVTVTVATIPTTPVITGTFVTCGLGTVTFTATSTYATTYTWTMPIGLTIMSGAGTSVVTVSTVGFANPGTITCTASNACGTSATTSQYVTKKPLPPPSISGPASVCALTTATYSVAPSAGATSYNWMVPTGMTITSGAGTTQITVSLAPPTVLGNMRVDAVNACGYVVGPIMFITGHAPSVPGTLSGPSNICGFTSGTYSIPPVAYASGYTWTVPSWMTITSGAGTTSITVVATGTPANGAVSVAATNVCGTGTARVLNVTTASPIPGAISGPTNICGMTTAAFSVPSLGTGYTYNWSLAMSAWTITSGAGTTAITCAGPGTPTSYSGLVKVTSTNTCASTSGIRTKAVTYCHTAIANNADQNGSSYSPLYPNPTNGEFKMDVTTDINEEMTIQVYDVLGNLVISEKHQVANGTSTLTTNLESYKTGMYFVRLIDSNASTVYSQTVIKQ